MAFILTIEWKKDEEGNFFPSSLPDFCGYPEQVIANLEKEANWPGFLFKEKWDEDPTEISLGTSWGWDVLRNALAFGNPVTWPHRIPPDLPFEVPVHRQPQIILLGDEPIMVRLQHEVG